MNIGEKIKNARKVRKITQSELAGDFMTRNMVSRIENGTAKPSLDTLVYIADKLSVPPSYLLSDDGDLFFYEKAEKLPTIYEAYTHGEYSYCIKKIKSMTRLDDELALIMATCCFEVGKASVLKGALHTALKMFSDSQKYSSMTRLSTENIAYITELYRAVALNIQSPMLEFEEEKYTRGLENNFDYEFYKYVAQDYSYSFTEPLYINHVKAKRLMQERRYREALELLRSNADLIIASGYNALILFRLYSDIELCCKELRDFELAYKYANKRLSMLEGFKS